MVVATALMLSSVAMAQDKTANRHKGFDKTEMIQRRTEKMVKQYGLSKDQAAQLLALNMEYANNTPMRNGFRGGRGHHKWGRGTDSASVARMQAVGKRMQKQGERMQQRARRMRASMDSSNVNLGKINKRVNHRGDSVMRNVKKHFAKGQWRMKEAQKRMEDYNTKLRGIMTGSQYVKYQEKMKKLFGHRDGKGKMTKK